MNDSEIIKALECHTLPSGCNDCPYVDKSAGRCSTAMVKDALDLIKRQQTEIEKLKSIQLKQGNIIDSLRGDKYECIGTIDAFKKKFEFADETINKIEDDLDRGNDNSWTREHIDEYKKGDDNEG